MPSAAPGLALELYIKEDSPSCVRAAENLARLLARYDETAFSYTLRNLTHVPLGEGEETVAMVPMLIVRTGRKPRRMVSELDDTTALEDLLAIARVARKSRPTP